VVRRHVQKKVLPFSTAHAATYLLPDEMTEALIT